MLERVDLGDVRRDLGRGLVRDLAAVVVVDLVAVVDGRVVRRSEHDARGGVQVTHRKGQRGNGLDARVHVDVHAVGGKDGGGHALEVLALEAGVARERERGVLVVGVEVVRHALGGLRDHVDVHAVGAHAERAAKAGGAKGEAAIEGVVELVLVALLHELLELSREVGLLDVVLPGLDRGLDACIHNACSPICSGRGTPRLNHTYREILLAEGREALGPFAGGRRRAADGISPPNASQDRHGGSCGCARSPRGSSRR